MKLYRSFLIAAPALTVALLTACGGGDDTSETADVTPATTPATTPAPTPTAAYIDKYVGTWSTACLTNPGVNESGKFTIVISKTSDTTASWTMSGSRVTGTTCTGTVLPNLFPVQTAALTYVGTIGGVDRFDSPNGKTTAKINGLTMTGANDLSAKDADGYPTIDAEALDFFRQ